MMKKNNRGSGDDYCGIRGICYHNNNIICDKGVKYKQNIFFVRFYIIRLVSKAILFARNMPDFRKSVLERILFEALLRGKDE